MKQNPPCLDDLPRCWLVSVPWRQRLAGKEFCNVSTSTAPRKLRWLTRRSGQRQHRLRENLHPTENAFDLPIQSNFRRLTKVIRRIARRELIRTNEGDRKPVEGISTVCISKVDADICTHRCDGVWLLLGDGVVRSGRVPTCPVRLPIRHG